ncbi:MAG: MBL fold metallo-hydrolase, partial [bacterium]
TAGIPVGGIVFPECFPPGEFGLADSPALPLFGVAAGDELELGRGVDCKVLHPPPSPLTGTNDDYNNNSLVLLLRMGAVSFLFTGDLEGTGEEYMLQYNRVPQATILKVAHHGARNSSSREFLEQIRPSLAVISTGPNSFGHPHQETLERLEALGVKIYRTDVDGAVRIRTDGKRVWVEKARGERE